MCKQTFSQLSQLALIFAQSFANLASLCRHTIGRFLGSMLGLLGIGDNQSHNIKHAFFEVGLAHDKIILIEISRRMATSSRSHSLETRLQGFSLCMTGMKAMRR